MKRQKEEIRGVKMFIRVIMVIMVIMVLGLLWLLWLLGLYGRIIAQAETYNF